MQNLAVDLLVPIAPPGTRSAQAGSASLDSDPSAQGNARFSHLLGRIRHSGSLQVNQGPILSSIGQLSADDALLLSLSLPEELSNPGDLSSIAIPASGITALEDAENGLGVGSTALGDLDLQDLLDKIQAFKNGELEFDEIQPALASLLDALGIEVPDEELNDLLQTVLGLFDAGQSNQLQLRAFEGFINRARRAELRGINGQFQRIGEHLLRQLRGALDRIQAAQGRAGAPVAETSPAQDAVGQLRGILDGNDAALTNNARLNQPSQAIDASLPIPDLIYINGEQALTTTASSASLQVVALGRNLTGHPLQTVQQLIEKLESLINAKDHGTHPSQVVASDASPPLGGGGLAQATHLFAAHRLSVTAPPPAPAELPQAVSQAIAAMSDMAERLRGDLQLDPGQLRAVIHLNPPSLGRIHINLSLDGDNRIVAQFQSDQSATEDFLRQNAQDFREGLEEQGFDSSQIDLQFGEDGSFAQLVGQAAQLTAGAWNG